MALCEWCGLAPAPAGGLCEHCVRLPPSYQDHDLTVADVFNHDDWS